MKKIILFFTITILISCNSNIENAGKQKWNCMIEGETMYSMKTDGTIGGAQKGCTCDQIYDFEIDTFGEADINALNKDFGCELDEPNILKSDLINKKIDCNIVLSNFSNNYDSKVSEYELEKNFYSKKYNTCIGIYKGKPFLNADDNGQEYLNLYAYDLLDGSLIEDKSINSFMSFPKIENWIEINLK